VNVQILAAAMVLAVMTALVGFVGAASPAAATATPALHGLYAWGAAFPVDCAPCVKPVSVPLPNGVTALAESSNGAGAYGGAVVIIGSNHNLYAWGVISFSLGCADDIQQGGDYWCEVKMPPGVTPVSVAAGPEYFVVLGSDGQVYSWGSNASGNLGDGTTTNTFGSPVVKVDLPALPAGVTITQVAANWGGNGSSEFGGTSMALASNGVIYGWGFDWFGQLGTFTAPDCGGYCAYTPMKVKPDGKTFLAKSISLGDGSVSAIGGDGNVWGWGDNEYGQLGIGTPVWNGYCSCTPTPTEVFTSGGPIRAATVAAGFFSSFAISADGTARGWGLDDNGELGNGSIPPYNTCGSCSSELHPVTVKMPKGVSATSISEGAGYPSADQTSIVIGSNGKVYAMGYGAEGALGNGSTTTPYSDTPVPVSLPSGSTPVSATGVIGNYPGEVALFGKLVVLTTSLPDATRGTAYAAQLFTNGGASTYGWKVISGSLPRGITLKATGLISGTTGVKTTTPRTFTFTVKVTHSKPTETAKKVLSLTLNS